jgi:hypothetical protein
LCAANILVIEVNVLKSNPTIIANFILPGEQAYILDAGLQACLPKPFTPQRLLETILTLLCDQ